FFFFSSRRRHTRSKRDWSSDVCSSDLDVGYRIVGVTASILGTDHAAVFVINFQRLNRTKDRIGARGDLRFPTTLADQLGNFCARSEERRVGKESRSAGSAPQSTRSKVE